MSREPYWTRFMLTVINHICASDIVAGSPRLQSEPTTRRWMVPALAAMLTVSAALPPICRPPPRVRRAAVRRHDPPQVYVETDPALISPAYGIGRTRNLPGPAAARTLPGYYGRPLDYDYQGPYYGGGPVSSYFWRLPYACGVYGYC